MTIDGFLPRENDKMLQWVRTDRHGFPEWNRKGASAIILPGIPFVDLMCDVDSSADSDIYLAEIHDVESAGLLRGLSLYHLIDEVVIYLFPYISGEGFSIASRLPSGTWNLCHSKTFKNGICRLTYCKSLQ